MFDDFDTQIQVEEIINEDMVLIEPEEWYKFLREKEIQTGQNNIIDFL